MSDVRAYSCIPADDTVRIMLQMSNMTCEAISAYHDGMSIIMTTFALL